MKRVMFLAILIASLGLFAWTVRRFGRLVLAGRHLDLGGRTGERVASVLKFLKTIVERLSPGVVEPTVRFSPPRAESASCDPPLATGKVAPPNPRDPP